MQEEQQRYNVIKLNNEAAKLINEGNFQQAIVLLRNALTEAKAIIEFITTHHDEDGQDQQAINQENEVSHNKTEIVSLDEYILQSYDGDSSRTWNQQEMDSSNNMANNTTEMYCYPLNLPELDQQQYNFSESSTLQILAAIVFNLALAHQLYATASSSRQPGKQDTSYNNKMILQAISLYESSWGLIQEYEQTITGNNNQRVGITTNVLFALIILNNVGTCYNSINESSEATNQCFEQLISSLMVMTANNVIDTTLPEQLVDNGRHCSALSSSSRRRRCLIGYLFQNAYRYLNYHRDGNSRSLLSRSTAPAA